jgi:ubiquinol-cytochrome c reductase iron-sulfur subunit
MAVKDQDKNVSAEVTRRDFIYVASGVLGAVAVGAAAWPLVDQMNPSADVLALSTTEVDLSAIEAGQSITVMWQGKPVFVRHRTEKEIDEARAVNMADLRDPETDQARASRPEWLIVVGVCTHLGCVPIGQKGDFDGWLCPCHGSHYDSSGRIRKGPAPRNLAVPSYKFINDTSILIG